MNRKTTIVIIIILIVVLCLIVSLIVWNYLTKEGEEKTEAEMATEEVEDQEDGGEVIAPETETIDTSEEVQVQTEIQEPAGVPEGNTQPVDQTYASCEVNNYYADTLQHGESYTTKDECQTCTCNNGTLECQVADWCLNAAPQ